MDTIRQGKILVQAVLLVIEALGITVSVCESVMTAIFKDTSTAIQNSSQMQKAIQAFNTALDEAGDNPWKKASALFFLLKDSKAAGIHDHHKQAVATDEPAELVENRGQSVRHAYRLACYKWKSTDRQDCGIWF